MSISAEYIRITIDEYNEFINAPETVDRFFGYLDPNNEVYAKLVRQQNRTYVLHTQWQTLHYLLTREVAEPGKSRIPPPLCNVVLGGCPVQFDYYKEDVRFLTPTEVKDVAQMLKNISPQNVKKTFLLNKHASIKIYKNPSPTDWNGDYLDWLIENYSSVRNFYIEARKENNAMLIWIG